MKSEILSLLISLFLIAVPVILGIYLKKIYGDKKETSKTQTIDRIVNMVVLATEQLSKNNAIKDKFKFAETSIVSLLADKGIKVSGTEIATCIESCVQKINERKNE